MKRRRAERQWLVISQIVQVLSFVVAMLLTSSGFAQSAHEVTLARSLFEEGISLADRGDWAGAADRFERAYALKPTSGIAFNWASALASTGKFAHASELLLAIVHDPNSSAELRSESEQKLAEIQPRLARLKVHIDESIAAQAVVQVDEKDWPKPVWDVAMPVDPGPHVAVCRLDGNEVARAEVMLSEGEQSDVSLVPAAAPAPAPVPVVPVAVAPSAHDDKRERRPLYKSWVLWTSIGVAVVGGTVAAIVLSQDSKSHQQAPIAGNTGPGVVRW